MSEKMQGLSFRGTILPALVAGLGLLASGCGSSEAVNESFVPGDDLKATVYQESRMVDVVGLEYYIYCLGDTAIADGYKSGANMSDAASKWICQRPEGKLPPAEEITKFLRTGQIPDQSKG